MKFSREQVLGILDTHCMFEDCRDCKLYKHNTENSCNFDNYSEDELSIAIELLYGKEIIKDKEITISKESLLNFFLNKYELQIGDEYYRDYFEKDFKEKVDKLFEEFS